MASVLLTISAALPVTAQVSTQTAAVAEPGLVPVALPDLSGMHESVQQQLREAYTSIQSLSQAGRTTGGRTSASRRVDRGEAYGTLGKLLMAAKYPAVAERCFRNARLLTPDDFRWPYYLGQLFISEGALTEAVEPLERALALRPGDLATLVWLGHIHIELGQPQTAQAVLSRARALDPDSAAVLYQLGRASLAGRDFASAVRYLEGALRQNPAAAVIHYPLAMAYRGLGDLEKAQANLDRTAGRGGPGATVTMPDPLMADLSTILRSPEVFVELAQQASARGDWPEAAAQFRRAIEMAPANAAVRMGLAQTLSRMGDARTALAELDKAIGLDPSLAPAHFVKGVLRERSGRDERAIAEYTAAVTNDPAFREAHFRLADALRRVGRLDAALSSYRRVLELVPESEEAHFGEAMALAQLSRQAEARERLRAAINFYPHQPAFAQALARLLAASPDPQVRDGRQALELVQALANEHKTTSVAETMAMALAELGRFEEAVEWQRLAMSVAADGGHPEVAQRMAANLALYQRHEPCRTPWRDDDPEYRPGPAVDPGLLGQNPF
jgi:tetratricopeptide (TPR) repeat protein